MGILSIDPAKKAAIDAARAALAVDQWFADEQAKGYETEYGWKLGLRDSDVALLTGNYVLAKEAAALNLPLPPVIDQDGAAHAMESLADLTALMLAYGQHRSQLSAEYASRKAEAS